MKTLNYYINAFLFLGLLTFSSPTLAQRATPDFWKCQNRVSGEWAFGRAPYACDVNLFMDETLLQKNYGPVVFSDSSSRTTERQRYMQNLQRVIREASIIYLERRKPNASSAEVNAYIRAMYVLANSESFWSHYRKASDNHIKVMRGDYGHGHGLMQVDDRWHYNAVDNGEAWNLLFNMKYGMDIFFNEWQRAASASCVPSPSSWEERTRSAWAAFNGGPSKICRWTSSNDKWSRNDTNFYEKYRTQAYRNYIANYDQPAAVNVPCLFDGNEQCSSPTNPDNPLQSNLLELTDGSLCVLNQGNLNCVQGRQSMVCLQRYYNRPKDSVYKPSSQEISDFERNDLDDFELCQDMVAGLLDVGSRIVTKLNINFRSTPGGTKVGIVPEGSLLTVLDFEVRDFAAGDRYYKVNYDGYNAYLYAGNEGDYRNWAEKAPDSSESTLIAKVGDRIRIESSSGINLRGEIQGSLIYPVPHAEIVEVLAREFRDEDRKVYYQVSYMGQTGWIYGGHSNPDPTFGDWASIVTEVAIQYLTVRDDLYYRFLLDCANFQCGVTGDYVRSPKMVADGDQVLLLEESGDFAKVKLIRTGTYGWLLKSDLVSYRGKQ